MGSRFWRLGSPRTASHLLGVCSGLCASSAIVGSRRSSWWSKPEHICRCPCLLTLVHMATASVPGLTHYTGGLNPLREGGYLTTQVCLTGPTTLSNVTREVRAQHNSAGTHSDRGKSQKNNHNIKETGEWGYIQISSTCHYNFYLL